MLTDHNLSSIKETHTYPTRSKDIPNRPRAKLNLYRNSFLYSSIKSFSELPAEVCDAGTLKIFARKCKTSVLTPEPTNCTYNHIMVYFGSKLPENLNYLAYKMQ